MNVRERSARFSFETVDIVSAVNSISGGLKPCNRMSLAATHIV